MQSPTPPTAPLAEARTDASLSRMALVADASHVLPWDAHAVEQLSPTPARTCMASNSPSPTRSVSFSSKSPSYGAQISTGKAAAPKPPGYRDMVPSLGNGLK